MRLNEINSSTYEEVVAWVKKNYYTDEIKVNPDGTVRVVLKNLYLSNKIKGDSLPFVITECEGSIRMHSNHMLSTLKGCPLHVKGDFDVDHCLKLTSLEHAPRTVDGDATFFKCGLTSLKWVPSFVGGGLDVASNKITSIDDMTETTILGGWDLKKNQIKSFHNIHKKVTRCNGLILIDRNPVESHVLGFILIEGLEGVSVDEDLTNEPVQQAFEIVNKYIGKGKSGVIEAQEEMLDLGLDDFAQL